jgi:Rrf2 family transcriptional regulator, iron-sulfur cluster assembly transcription factor
MKVNTKIRYGLRTMLEIALCDENKGILQKEISKNQQISQKYLDQIISSLKASDLIISKSGKKSGYILKRPQSAIKIYDIYKAFEPELSIVHCVNRPVTCFITKLCVANEYWAGLNEVILNYLQGTTLEDITKKHKELASIMQTPIAPEMNSCG